MKKKIFVAVISVLIILFLVIINFTLLNTKEDENITVNISLNELVKKIENTDEYDFSKMQDIDKNFAVETYLIDESKIQDITGKFPIIGTKSSMYVVIKADKNNLQDIKMAFESYGNEYEKQWSTYLPDQYELVKNRKIGLKGNYVYMVISENPERIVNLIK